MRWRLLPLCLLWLGCPSPRAPERGVELRYSKPSGTEARDVVEKRLAALGSKARLHEDKDELMVRIPDGEAVGPVKAALARPGKLELCEESQKDGPALCQVTAPEGLERLDEPTRGWGCYLQGKAAGAVLAEAKKTATARVVAQRVGDVFRSFSVSGCSAPGIAEVKTVQVEGFAAPNLALRFTPEGAAALERLSTASLGRRLIILLDGEVLMAPVVQSVLTAGRAQIVSPGGRDEAQALAAALTGGPLEGLTLEKEGRFGPPSLFPGAP